MTNSTFLHEDKAIPPDETLDRKTQICPRCGAEMWLTRLDKKLSDENTEVTYSYECKNCGCAEEKTAVE